MCGCWSEIVDVDVAVCAGTGASVVGCNSIDTGCCSGAGFETGARGSANSEVEGVADACSGARSADFPLKALSNASECVVSFGSGRCDVGGMTGP